MRTILGGAICCWLFFGAWCPNAIGDGGAVCLSTKKSGYLITVFSAPSSLRAGPVDLSVLVQDARTGEPLPQGRVTICLSIMGQPALEYLATQEAATNKLLRAAQFDIPLPGRWDLEVRVDGSRGMAVVGCALEVAEPLPRWREMWPWICWPALALVLFGIHQVLVHRKNSWRSSPS